MHMKRARNLYSFQSIVLRIFLLNNHGKKGRSWKITKVKEGFPRMTYQYTCENSAEFIFSARIVFMRMRGLKHDRTDLMGGRGGYKHARVKITPKFILF